MTNNSIFDIQDIPKYKKRIKELVQREISGSYDNLLDAQKYLFEIVHSLSKGNTDIELDKDTIKKAFEDSKPQSNYGFTNRSNLITDFCYNMVNLEDNENKFLLSPSNGKFIFKGFNWYTTEIVPINWNPRRRKKYVIGAYIGSNFEWDFHDFLLDLGQGIDVSSNALQQKTSIFEGGVSYRNTKIYKRVRLAREQCISHYGSICRICKFDYEQRYGDIGRGFIEVHHLEPLSKKYEHTEIDPIRDLIPICANCHRIAHRRLPPFTPNELEEMIKGRP